MKGIIQNTLEWSKRKGKSISVVKRYLKAKHKISVSLEALMKRINK